MWHVYRLFGANDKLLYVGCSKDPKERLKQHKFYTPWFHEVVRWSISAALSEEDASAIEGAAIASELPAYNKNGRRVPSKVEAYRRRLKKYDERSQRALRLREIGKASWKVIGEILGVSRQRAQQLAAKAKAQKSLIKAEK